MMKSEITPKPPSSEEPQSQFVLTLRNKEYLLDIEIEEPKTLVFTCAPIKSNKKIYFISKCTLNTLRKKSKAFSLYSNLTEILYLFEELYKNKLISLELDESDDEDSNNKNVINNNDIECINLVIKLFVLVKEEIIVFPLEKNCKSENDYDIENINQDINSLSNQFAEMENQYHKKIRSLTKEINNLRNENATFKNQINILTDKINELKNQISENTNSNDSYRFNSIQDLIDRVKVLEEWKNDIASLKKKSSGYVVQKNKINDNDKNGNNSNSNEEEEKEEESEEEEENTI